MRFHSGRHCLANARSNASSDWRRWWLQCRSQLLHSAQPRLSTHTRQLLLRVADWRRCGSEGVALHDATLRQVHQDSCTGCSPFVSDTVLAASWVLGCLLALMKMTANSPTMHHAAMLAPLNSSCSRCHRRTESHTDPPKTAPWPPSTRSELRPPVTTRDSVLQVVDGAGAARSRSVAVEMPKPVAPRLLCVQLSTSSEQR